MEAGLSQILLVHSKDKVAVLFLPMREMLLDRQFLRFCIVLWLSEQLFKQPGQTKNSL
jgi:hypothetical protein